MQRTARGQRVSPAEPAPWDFAPAQEGLAEAQKAAEAALLSLAPRRRGSLMAGASWVTWTGLKVWVML